MQVRANRALQQVLALDCAGAARRNSRGIDENVSRLTDLIAHVKQKDSNLADDLENEIRALAERRQFGLNFERHRPEAVELPARRVRKGDKVRVLPRRGSNERGDHRLWRVARTEILDGIRWAHLVLIDGDESTVVDASDTVVAAEFRDPIYPGLRSTGRIERGGDRPFHVVISAENYHALQTLQYTHRGRVDCIYIDPPYNTGAKDWKYNNDYVDGDDLYRHSKWLAFMERRLLLAKELLNPDDSVLIVTIDEKEYARLALLLGQVFPEAEVQMVSSVIKPGGTSRSRLFSRVEEYLFFVYIGDAEVVRTGDPMLNGAGDAAAVVSLKDSDLFEGMVRRGIGVVRAQRPKQFYPIYIDTSLRRIVEVGDPVDADVSRDDVHSPVGLTAVWPIKDDGTEGFWQLSPSGLRRAISRGTVRVGTFNKKTGQWRIQYMKAQKARYIEDGTVKIAGRDANGVVILERDQTLVREKSTARTVWTKASHDASVNGAGLLNKVIPGRKFPFPKSLYAVEDAMRFFVGDKPEAVVLDFFAGSGTTAHAVMRLNKQDGGRRRSISVTNNEVSAGEQNALRGEGLRPGDEEWERHGICEYITRPRLAAAVTGLTPDGEPIDWSYKYGDQSEASDGFEENVEFFALTYESPWRVARHRAFEAIAPLLWLRAGAEGSRVESLATGWAVADTYGIVQDLDMAGEFVRAVSECKTVAMAFIVTDDDRRYQMVCRALSEEVEPVRLYESYLQNFELNGRN